MSGATLAVLRARTEHLSEALREAGALAATERLALCPGSQTYGRPWRLVVMRDGESAHYAAPVDYLGATKSEAERVLVAMLATLYAVRRAQAVTA